jgi:hypothetical protein
METALSKVAPQLFGVPGVIVSRTPTEARCMVNGVFGDAHDGPMLFSKCQWVSCSERPGVRLSELKLAVRAPYPTPRLVDDTEKRGPESPDTCLMWFDSFECVRLGLLKLGSPTPPPPQHCAQHC